MKVKCQVPYGQAQDTTGSKVVSLLRTARRMSTGINGDLMFHSIQFRYLVVQRVEMDRAVFEVGLL